MVVIVLVPWSKEDIDESTSVGSREEPSVGVVTAAAVGGVVSRVAQISDADNVQDRHYWYLAARERSEEHCQCLLSAVLKSKVWELGLQSRPKAFEEKGHGS